jgi:hypothetical protein
MPIWLGGFNHCEEGWYVGKAVAGKGDWLIGMALATKRGESMKWLQTI